MLETAFEIRPSIQVYRADGVIVQTVPLGQTDMVRPSSTDTIAWTATGLAPGTYYVRTSNPIRLGSTLGVTFTSGPWIDELFDNIVCVAADCDPLKGTPVTVVAGQTATGVNFTLEVGASISGEGISTLQEAQSYDIFDARGVQLPSRIAPYGTGYTASAYIANGLPAGTYYLVAHRATDNSAPETLYPSFPCDGCPVTSGTPVTIAAGESKSGINFAKPSSGGISGTIRSDASANPPNSPLTSVDVTVFASNGTGVSVATTPSDGTFSIPALAPGSYYVTARGPNGYVDGLYDGTGCAGCNPTTGTPVTVMANETTACLDLTLREGTGVSGVVFPLPIGAIFGAGSVVFYASSPDSPAARAAVNVFNAGGLVLDAGFGTTLPQGAYYLQMDPIAGHVQLIYPGIPCPLGICPTTLATPVTVGSTAVAGINFNAPSCSAPLIAPSSLAQAAVGSAYRQTLLATGAAGAVRFVIAPYPSWTANGQSAGMLPPGLSLDGATGVLSGTPTTSGRFTFTIAVVDAAACAGVRTYTLDVPPCPFTLNTPSASLRASGEPWLILLSDTCGAFTATSNASWITVQSVMGTSVGIVAAPNTGGPRQGTVAVGPRVFTVYQSGAVSSPPFGFVDAPADGALVSGSVGISGWALDDVGVTNVLIYRDPVAGEPAQLIFVGTATFVPGARPDVAALYSKLPFNTRAGWGYLLLTNMLPNQGNGAFRFWAFAQDADLNQTLLGTRTVDVVNASATAPFGAIDTPDQGATISGSAYVNFGWGLTPQPKMIPFDGSTVTVLIDGAPVGTLTGYNFFRPDVSSLFAGLKNSGGPVGYRIIDTTALSEGLHTIAWLATDDGSVTTGIGSRYFTVSNSAWQPSVRASFLAASTPQTSSVTAPPASNAREIARADATAAVPARVDGVDLGRKEASLTTLPIDPDGTRAATMSSLQSLQLSLGAADNSCPATYAGYLVVRGELHALPIGSSLDPSGTFYWHPGPGYFGTYRLVFVRSACDGAQRRIQVTVTIR